MQGVSYTVGLLWRTDAGPDTPLYSATLPGTAYDADAGYALFSFSTTLAAVPAHCGDVLVLTALELPVPDGGDVEIFEAYPTMVIP